VTYLAITVLATITLYYELYVGGSVSTLILANLHMSFTFFVLTLAFGALIGAFGSLFAGITDRLGRANLVVFGLFFTAVFVAFIMPTATNKWTFTIESFVVSFVEGVCLVATPALIRDFSPQVGRATAMGFWTSGPVIGSLIVSVVGSATVPAIVNDDRFWTHEYRICGIAGIVVFVIALIGLKELSPRLRDQLMVTLRDRALIEARAKGLTDEDIEAALRHPFRQLLKTDVIVSSIAVSIMLLIYYTAVAFAVIYLTTVFGFSVKDANGLGNWNWGFNVIAVILVGIISDRFRVRKPFMVIGGVLGAVMVVVYLLQAAILWLATVPVQLGMLERSPAGPLVVIGAVLFVVGFAFESVGDWQLARFKASATAGQIMDRGLWRYTRHPNYFGDFCMWWGLFAISAGSWRELPALAGPLLMTFILTRGTGARMTDRRMTASRPQYADYIARTSGFIPLPPKRAPKRNAAAAAPGERA